MKKLLILLVLVLVGCASEPVYIKGSGARAAPPGGWVEYCGRHPDDPSCEARP